MIMCVCVNARIHVRKSVYFDCNEAGHLNQSFSHIKSKQKRKQTAQRSRFHVHNIIRLNARFSSLVSILYACVLGMRERAIVFFFDSAKYRWQNND